MTMFFSKKSAPKTPVANSKSFEIPYAQHFKGFKRFPMRTHGDNESENNNEALYGKDLSALSFKFVCSGSGSNRIACLYADNFKIGTIYESEQIKAIEHGQIEKIHLEPKEEVIIGKNGNEVRHRFTVLVKYKE
jgi:hypothetical protein